jgi:hypothetical protein
LPLNPTDVAGIHTSQSAENIVSYKANPRFVIVSRCLFHFTYDEMHSPKGIVNRVLGILVNYSVINNVLFNIGE